MLRYITCWLAQTWLVSSQRMIGKWCEFLQILKPEFKLEWAIFMSCGNKTVIMSDLFVWNSSEKKEWTFRFYFLYLQRLDRWILKEWSENDFLQPMAPQFKLELRGCNLYNFVFEIRFFSICDDHLSNSKLAKDVVKVRW